LPIGSLLGIYVNAENAWCFRISKQAFIQDVPNPIDLPDGSPSFLDYMGSRNNRFTTPEAAAKNHILYFDSYVYHWL